MTGEVVEDIGCREPNPDTLTGHIVKTKVLEVFDKLIPSNHIAVGALLVTLVQYIL